VIFLTRLNASVWAVILITAILIPVASGEEAVTTPNTLKVGMVAPDFTLKDEGGTEQSLSDYLGKKNIVLAFYPKDFTGG
jgi:cytochrome oxidase Cu insertion factor (SCO1/SenC/PrrC family)